MKPNGQPVSLGEQRKLLRLFEENRYAEWLGKNGRLIGFALLAVLVALVLIFRWGTQFATHTEDDFIHAQELFGLWQSAADSGNIAQVEEILPQLESILKSHASLHAKYDGVIAQKLLALDAVEKALPFAERTLRRTQSNALPLYHLYAEASLLMSQGMFGEALTAAQQLQAALESDPKPAEGSPVASEAVSGVLLGEYNALRLALLAQRRGAASDEVVAWQLWQQKYGASPHSLAHQLTFGSVDLGQYVQHRLQELNSAKA